MPETVVCNLCGADDPARLFRLRDYRFLVDDIEWTAWRCRACGLGYLNPRPTDEEMERYYPDKYFAFRTAHTERYVQQAAYVPHPPGRLLDIGTATGDFLNVMKHRGWQVEGIEPFESAGNPHDLPIHRFDFPRECGLPSGNFDVITAWAVFEHLRDPNLAFDECARLLKPSGSLIIQVPNLRSIYARWALQEDIPRHLYFFEPATLRRYGERHGLELTRVVHTTNLFGGSGRGVLRMALVKGAGGDTVDFFEFWRASRRERFRRRPLLAAAWTATAAVEAVLLADWIVRAARISGQIVVEYRKAA